MQDNVTIGQPAVEGMMKGIKTVTQAIRLTYGPSGCNAVIENEFYPFHQVANDAQTIIQSVWVKDEIEKRGVAFLKELSDKANKDSGDGRKTTCILAEEILERGYASGISGVALKRQLDKYIPIIEQKIDEQKQPISEGEIRAVAKIAGENDHLADLLQEIYREIGKDGIIQTEGSSTYQSSWRLIQGVRFQGTGYLSPFMVHDEEVEKEGRKATKAVYEKPLILVTKRKISSINDVDPLLKKMRDNGMKDLVIFTDDMDSGVASMLVNTHLAHIFNILIIKAPVLWKPLVFEDFAKITGATIVEDASGVNFKNLSMSHLGTCGKIVVDKDETTVTGITDITEHLEALKAQAKEGDNDAKIRLQWLNTKTAIVKLGANNESELSYLRLKCDDAINSCRLALRDGVVKGGGICLRDIATTFSFKGGDVGEIIAKSLFGPYIQNMNNMGLEVSEVLEDFGPEVIDASVVVKNAVRNAISLASTVLTAGVVVTLPPKTPEQLAAEASINREARF